MTLLRDLAYATVILAALLFTVVVLVPLLGLLSLVTANRTDLERMWQG